MISGTLFTELLLALDGTSEQPHFDRRAFRARRIFATLAPDGRRANLLLTPDQQTMKCELYPHMFAAVQNKWGMRGWTTVDLDNADEEVVRLALEDAWRNGNRK